MRIKLSEISFNRVASVLLKGLKKMNYIALIRLSSLNFKIKNTLKKLINKQVLFRIKKMRGQVDELFVIHDFFKRNKASGIMIDVGVHFGESSIPFLNSGWKVYGFEPDKNNFEIVNKNIPANSKFHLFI